MSNKKSEAWNYFTEPDENSRAKCIYCNQLVAVSKNSTGNLIRHLRRHPGITRYKVLENDQRTTTQFRKCWDNIKTRRKHALIKRKSKGPDNGAYPSSTTPEHSDADPLTSVKHEEFENAEQILWGDDKHDNQTNVAPEEIEIEQLGQEDSNGVTAEVIASQQYVEQEPINGTSEPRKVPVLKRNGRSEQREEELHKLRVAEKLWLLKTLKEQHRKAQLDREKAQLERERAEIERDKAQLDLNRAMRIETEVINNS